MCEETRKVSLTGRHGRSLHRVVCTKKQFLQEEGHLAPVDSRVTVVVIDNVSRAGVQQESRRGTSTVSVPHTQMLSINIFLTGEACSIHSLAKTLQYLI